MPRSNRLVTQRVCDIVERYLSSELKDEFVTEIGNTRVRFYNEGLLISLFNGNGTSLGSILVAADTGVGLGLAAAKTLRSQRPNAHSVSSEKRLTPASNSQAPKSGAANPKPPRMKVNAHRAPKAPSRLRKLPAPGSASANNSRMSS